MKLKLMQKFTKAIAAIMLTISIVCFAGCKKDDESNIGTYNGHEYVDLGLPSGTLWATCNVGADSPKGYGDYFAWGEIREKYTYTWNNYKYAKGSSWDDPRLTKYCSKSNLGNNGFTDNMTVLLPGDDAATAKWGSGWCMPTADQWRELMDNTITEWTTQNGVKGRLFTALNGSTLFLPAAGSRYAGGLGGAGSYGYYWSSSLHTDDPHSAWDFYFNADHYSLGNGSRIDGRPIRAVRSLN